MRGELGGAIGGRDARNERPERGGRLDGEFIIGVYVKVMIEPGLLAPHEIVNLLGEMIGFMVPGFSLFGLADVRSHLREAARRENLLAAKVDKAHVATLLMLCEITASRRVVHTRRSGILEIIQAVFLARSVGLEPAVIFRASLISLRQARQISRALGVKPLAPRVKRGIDAASPGRLTRFVSIGHRDVTVFTLHLIEVVEISETVVVSGSIAAVKSHVAAVPLPDYTNAGHTRHLGFPAV